jgi:hypothetical protein
LDELRSKFAALEETQETARRELMVLTERRERVEQLQRDADALLERYSESIPEALDNLTPPEERHNVYKMMRLRVNVRPGGIPELTWAVTGEPTVCHSESVA